MSWVIRMIEVPNSVRSSRMRVRIWACTVTSSAVVGSSAISTFGRHDSAMAIITRWRMPPESSCGYCLSRRAGSPMWTASSMDRARASALPPSVASWVRIASTSCDPTVITGLSEVIGSWKIIAMAPPRSRRIARSGSVVSSCPASLIEPPRWRSEGDRSRMIDSAVSDFPEPDSPARPRVSPGCSVKSTFSSTGRRPCGVRASMQRPSTARTGSPAGPVTTRRCGGNRRRRPSSAGRRSR